VKPIKWYDKLSVDDGLIDEDHRLLLDIINQFREQVGHFKTSNEALGILESLKLYSEQHFGREEELQRVSEYPYRDAHHSEHIHLIKKLEAVMEETKAASGEYLNTIMGDKIGQFLKGWLIDHVLDNDLRMKPYVEEMKDLSGQMESINNA
jgi:hemerythrin